MADPIPGEPLADRPRDGNDQGKVVRGRVVNLDDDIATIDIPGHPPIKVGDEVEIDLGSGARAYGSLGSKPEGRRVTPTLGGGYGNNIRIRLKSFDHRVLDVDTKRIVDSANRADVEVRTHNPLSTKDSTEIEQAMSRFSQIERQFDQVERDHFVTIDLDTGEFSVAPSRLTSVQSFESKFGAGKRRITMHIGSNLS